MPVTGISRYFKLAQNVQNPLDYFFYKWSKGKKSLKIITKPHPVQFDVVKSIYLVFKEVFMSDVYNIQQLIQKLPAKPVIIDIGANVGFFDILVLSKLPGACIAAYEPVEQNAAYFKKILAGNPVLKQVAFNSLAVTGKKTEYIELYAENTEESQVVASVIEGFNEHNSKKIKVPAISLSEIIDQIGDIEIDVLKMDCEGSEYEIVYNTPEHYFSKIKYMLIEVHDLDKASNNIGAFIKWITSLGFSTAYSSINVFCYAVEAKNNRYM